MAFRVEIEVNGRSQNRPTYCDVPHQERRCHSRNLPLNMGEQEDEKNLVTKLQLRLHASNLPRCGIMKTLPSAYAMVTSVSGQASRSGPERFSIETDSHGMRKVEWGRTEIIHKCSHPQWTKMFTLNYEYGSECHFFVQVFQFVDAGKEPILLGTAVCEVGDILGSFNYTKVKRLPKKGGAVYCRLEPIQEKNMETVFRFQFAAKNLDITRNSFRKLTGNIFHSLPDTVLEIAKSNSGHRGQVWTTVYRSRPVSDSLNPTWDNGEIDLASICNGDLNQPVRMSVLVCRKKAPDLSIAFCETTLHHILNTQRDFNSDEAEEDQTKHGFSLQRSMSDLKEVGRLCVELAQVINADDGSVVTEGVWDGEEEAIANESTRSGTIEDPYAVDIAALPTPMAAPATFQDYVNAGCHLDFCVAIDFTSSNGDPRVSGTLHDQSEDVLNDYEETITSIGNAVAVYSDVFSIQGFGAKFGNTTRHLFQCGPTPEVQGVEGILDAYKSVFKSDLTMSGPTVFDGVLQAAAVRARRYQKNAAERLRYCVLLVVTDGRMDQMAETKRKLGVYSSVPLSVVFVGVGLADFKAMYTLCDSLGQNRSNATFVEFRKHQHDPTALGKAALQDIPSQLAQYMLQNGITP